MRRHFEEIEDELKNRLLRMGGLVEEMMSLSIQALVERSSANFAKIDESESVANQMHMDIDEHSFKLIALHQPAAMDLRFIMAAVKINSDLERIGDQSVNISESVAEILKHPPISGKLYEIPAMVENARGMLKDGLDAFVKKDVSMAWAVVKRDDIVDRLKDDAQRDLTRLMESDTAAVARAFQLILISRSLERIADHATNIAENVVFMVQGIDIRHNAGALPAGSVPPPANP